MTSRTTIPLILFTLALSFAAVALIVNGALKTPTVQDIASACRETFTAAQTPLVCPEPETNLQNATPVLPSTTHPGFSYISSWNAVVDNTLSDKEAAAHTITLTANGLFPVCETCTEGILAKIITEPYTLNAGETLDGYVQSLYVTIPDNVIQKKTLSNGTQYTVSGNSPDNGPFSDILFFGATTRVRAYFPESDFLPAGTAERTTLISSLDFSLIP